MSLGKYWKFMKPTSSAVWRWGLAWIISVCLLVAQADRGSIQGTITDPSGAPVADARVQVINIENNSRLDFRTNEIGNYLAANLPPGSYRMVAQKQGFTTLIREPIIVNPQSSLRVDFSFQVGAVSDTVTIDAAPPLLDISATSSPNNLTEKFINDLPMIVLVQKRNITDFLRYLPGNTSSNGSLSSGEAAESWSGRVNSAVQGATEIFIDGAPSSEWATRRGSVLENGPVVETISEYTVVANAFNAEYGGFGSWFTTVTIKSGTNDLHGQVNNYFANDALNARNFFQGAVTPKLRQNEGGFQLGGPVHIPKVYDGRNKTFFFFGQGLFYSTRSGSGGLLTIPRTDFKTGDFSNLVSASGTQIPIFDPTTTRPDGQGGFVRDQFSGNRIPTSRISPVSARIAALMPNPDLAAQTNNFYNRSGTWPYFNTFTSTAKVDHSFSTKQKIAVTYSNQRRPRLLNGNGWGYSTNAVPGLPVAEDALEGFQQQTVTSQTGRINHDYIFSPTVLNHFTVGVDRYVNPVVHTNTGKGWSDALGITGLPSDLGMFPYITFSGGTGAPINIGKTNQGFNGQMRYSINEHLTWVRGRHTMKFGFSHWRYSENNRAQANTAGNFTFSNQMTSQPNSPMLANWGSSFASFLLGEIGTASTTIPYTIGNRFRSYGLFAQDDWRVTSKLTLSYGLRWDVAPRPYEVQDKVSSFSPDVMNPVGVPGALVFGGSGAGRTGDQFIKTWYGGFGPRLGLAYSVNPKTIVRASAGIYYSDQPATGGYTAGFTSSPTFSSPDNFTSVYNWSTSSFPQSFGRPPILDPSFQNNQSIVWLLSSGTRLPQILTWTFGIQRELSSNLSLDLAYIGSHSTHLAQGTSFNYVDKKYLSLGNLLLQRIGTPAAASAGVPMPFPQFPTYTTNTVAQALMPYPQYTSVTSGNSNDPVGRAQFNSMQVKVNKRYSNGLTVLAFWSWMKNMSSLQTQQYTPERPVTYSGDSPPHTLSVSWSYDLPLGPGKRFLGSSNGVLAQIAGGWNLAGALRYTSGTAMSFTVANNLSILGYPTKYANYVSGAQMFDKTNPRDFDPSMDRYLRSGAFVAPSAYEFGNTAPTLDWVRGWTQKSESLSLGKKTKIWEKVGAELRIDVNNPFNFVRWSNPNNSITSADYGKVTGSAEGRRVQLYLAISF